MFSFFDICNRKLWTVSGRFARFWRSRLRKMIIYYSGEGHHGNPEVVLQNEANVMLTFHKSSGKDVENRFLAIHKKRKGTK
jgi:hypothetical protein